MIHTALCIGGVLILSH